MFFSLCILKEGNSDYAYVMLSMIFTLLISIIKFVYESCYPTFTKYWPPSQVEDYWWFLIVIYLELFQNTIIKYLFSMKETGFFFHTKSICFRNFTRWSWIWKANTSNAKLSFPYYNSLGSDKIFSFIITKIMEFCDVTKQ
jgi:hypothetical protein